MSKTIIPNEMSDAEFNKQFKGIMIPVSDIAGDYQVPGWECRVCGWRIGSADYPPPHACPDNGIQQRCEHEWGEDQSYPDGVRLQNIIYRECSKCGERQHRFASSKWLD